MNPTSRQLDSAFAVFDKDGSGTIDPEELMAILTDPKGGAPLSIEAAKVWRPVVGGREGGGDEGGGGAGGGGEGGLLGGGGGEVSDCTSRLAQAELHSSLHVPVAPLQL